MAIVATAKHHTLAATVSGQLYSWGGEKFGKLGHHSEKTLDEDKICTYPKYVEGDLKKKRWSLPLLRAYLILWLLQTRAICTHGVQTSTVS